MSQPIDIVKDSLPRADLLVLEEMDQTAEGMVMRARSKEETPACPACLSSEIWRGRGGQSTFS